MRCSARSPGGSRPRVRGAPPRTLPTATRSFEKTFGQWIASSEHRKNLLLHNATRVGIASVKDASGRRTYWAMEIAGDYAPPPSKKKGEKASPQASPKASSPAKRKPASAACHINLLGLCL